MISYVEKGAGLNFKGKPKVKVTKREHFPVEVKLGKHATLHMDDEAARALLVELQTALAPGTKRGAK